MTLRPLRPTLIFDLDNTLCECGKYYWAAQDQFAQVAHDRLGLDQALVLEVLKQLDLLSTRLPNAFARDRFPRSFEATSVALDVIAEHPVDLIAANQAWVIGNSVFDAPYELYPGVRSTLEAYRAGGWHLVLCSKGDQAVQERKITINRLQEIFAPEATYITLKKSTDLLRKIVVDQRVDLARTWVIGDSPRDDIAPALELGLGTVFVNTGSGWVYDVATVEPLLQIDAVEQLRNELPVDPTFLAASVALQGALQRKAAQADS